MKRIQPCQLATVCVPWGKSGEFLEPVFRRQVSLLRAAGLENLYIFGTAGEGYALTDPMFKEIATVFLEEMRGGGLCQLGVIGLSVAQDRGHMDGAYDKLYARLADPKFPLDLLSPYQGASPAAFDKFKTWLAKEAPGWAITQEN